MNKSKDKYQALDGKWWHRLAKVVIWLSTGFALLIGLITIFAYEESYFVFDFEEEFNQISGGGYTMEERTSSRVKESYVQKILNEPYNPELVTFNCVKGVIKREVDTGGSADSALSAVFRNNISVNDCSTAGSIQWKYEYYTPVAAYFFLLFPVIVYFLLWAIYTKVILYVAYGKDIPSK